MDSGHAQILTFDALSTDSRFNVNSMIAFGPQIKSLKTSYVREEASQLKHWCFFFTINYL